MPLDVRLRVVATCDECGNDEDAAKFGPVTSERTATEALKRAGWLFGPGRKNRAICLFCQPDGEDG